MSLPEQIDKVQHDHELRKLECKKLPKMRREPAGATDAEHFANLACGEREEPVDKRGTKAVG